MHPQKWISITRLRAETTEYRRNIAHASSTNIQTNKRDIVSSLVSFACCDTNGIIVQVSVSFMFTPGRIRYLASDVPIWHS